MVPIGRDQERREGPVSEAEITQYVERLKSLKQGLEAMTKLIACGRSAIEPLRQFLLEGKPSAIYQPRQLAAEALSSLGARDVLIAYLKQKKEITDPEIRMGEEAVESTAARELARWPSEEVFVLLLGLVKERCLIGAMEALGEFQRLEAVPWLIKALEDDVCRRAAEDALRKIGPSAEPDLIRAAVTPRLSGDGETPSSLLRRRSAVRLLAEFGIAPDRWGLLRQLLEEADGGILTAMFRIAARAAGAKDKELLGRHIIKAIESTDWYSRTEMENALIEFFDVIKPIVEEEIALRHRKTDKDETIVDPLLTTLLRVKHRAESGAGNTARTG